MILVPVKTAKCIYKTAKFIFFCSVVDLVCTNIVLDTGHLMQQNTYQDPPVLFKSHNNKNR